MSRKRILNDYVSKKDSGDNLNNLANRNKTLTMPRNANIGYYENHNISPVSIGNNRRQRSQDRGDQNANGVTFPEVGNPQQMMNHNSQRLLTDQEQMLTY